MKNFMDVTEKEKRLLHLIHDKKPIQTKELYRLAGLKSSNCYDIVNRLVKKGVIRKELSDSGTHKGRPSENLILNYSYKSCLFVFLSKSVSLLAVTDLAGNILVKRPYDFNENVTLDQFTKDAVDFIRENDDCKICSVNAVLGSNPQNQNSTGIHPSFTNEGFVKALSEATGLDVVIDSISRTAATAIYRSRYREMSDSLCFCNLSTGIGLGVIYEKKLLSTGGKIRPGIEHWIIDPEGESCTCGKRGCLVTYAGTRNIVSKAWHMKDIGFEIPLSDESEFCFENICSLANNGCEILSDMMVKAAWAFSVAIQNLYSLFHFKIVVVGGELCNGNAVFRDALRHELDAKVPVKLVFEDNYINQTAQGICEVLFENYFSQV